AGRHAGRPAARDRGRARRRVHLVRVPRRGGIRHNHPGATVQALRALRTPGAHRMRRAGGWLLAAGALTLPLWLQSPYHVHVTISFAGVISLLSVNWIELTNGPLGLPGVPAPALGPWSLRTKTAYYYLVLAAVVLSYAVCRRIVRSRIGRALVALRENEALAESIGVDVTHYLVLAAVVSAAMAGLGG